MKKLLDSSKPFYKANLHCHTVYSDGKWTPEKVKEEFKAKGYSIVAFTDHEHIISQSHLNDENFLALVGAEIAIKEIPEISSLKKTDMMVTHFNVYSKDPSNVVSPCYEKRYDRYGIQDAYDRLVYDGEYKRDFSIKGINEMLKIFKEKGFLVSYNHPSWSLEDASRYLQFEGIDFVEIFNTSCNFSARTDDEHVLDDFFRHGKKVFCTCADDNHNIPDRRGQDVFGGWVCINADKLDYAEIIGALERGDFYASTGPEIYSLTIEGQTVTIETSDAKDIGLITKGRRAPVVYAEDGGFITSATFALSDLDTYFRIRVTDQNGKRAYTQVYPVPRKED
ncbi:MAG: hypothetical protein IJZ73_03170 [Clostridia bacterium]|nr:hypothetical protein [Clostridia bacterium]